MTLNVSKLHLWQLAVAGFQNRTLLPRHQYVQQVWCLGAHRCHCVYHCSYSPNVMRHSASWRDSEHSATPSADFGDDYITSFSMAADSIYWAAINGLCDLH